MHLRSASTIVLLASISGGAAAQEAKLDLVPLPIPQNPDNQLVSWSMADASDDGSTLVGQFQFGFGKLAALAPDPQTSQAFTWRPDDDGLEILPPKNARTEPLLTNDLGDHIVFHGPAPLLLVYERGTDTLLHEIAIPGHQQSDAFGLTSLIVDQWGTAIHGWFQPAAPSSPAKAFAFNTSFAPEYKFLPINVEKNPFGEYTSEFRLIDMSRSGSITFGRFSTPVPGASPAFAYFTDGHKTATTSHFRGGIPVAMARNDWIPSVFVGRADRGPALGNIAALWYLDMRPDAFRIALPAGMKTSQFFDVSDNGEVAVGSCATAVTDDVRGFVWIRARGSRELTKVLEKFEIAPPSDLTLRAARFVSGDGKRIFGFAKADDGQVYLYRVTLPQSEVCYFNCDGSTGANYLTADDLACFQQRLAAGHFYTNFNLDHDKSGKPIYDAKDLAAFTTAFSSGCPE